MYGTENKADPARAERILLELTAKGDAAAKFLLGRAYIEIPALKGKAKQGVKLLEEVGEQGNSESYTALGNTFLWGTAELKPDAAKAQAYLEKAAAANNVNGLRTLGEQLVTGWVLKPDRGRGEGILQKLATDGNTEAKLALGRIYVEATELKGKAQQGLKFLEEAGEQGSSESYAILGNAFLWGTAELKPDAAMAQAYLEKAAAANNVEGARSLAEQLVTGWVLKPDPMRGETMLNELVKKGDRKAEGILGRVLLNGEGLKRNSKPGRKLLASAGRAGDMAALETLGTDLMWNGRNAGDPEKARQLLTKAAQGGRSKAWLTLAEGASFNKLGKKVKRLSELRTAGAESKDRSHRRVTGAAPLVGDRRQEKYSGVNQAA